MWAQGKKKWKKMSKHKSKHQSIVICKMCSWSQFIKRIHKYEKEEKVLEQYYFFFHNFFYTLFESRIQFRLGSLACVNINSVIFRLIMFQNLHSNKIYQALIDFNVSGRWHLKPFLFNFYALCVTNQRLYCNSVASNLDKCFRLAANIVYAKSQK